MVTLAFLQNSINRKDCYGRGMEVVLDFTHDKARHVFNVPTNIVHVSRLRVESADVM